VPTLRKRLADATTSSVSDTKIAQLKHAVPSQLTVCEAWFAVCPGPLSPARQNGCVLLAGRSAARRFWIDLDPIALCAP
jgi:hypothetical protein